MSFLTRAIGTAQLFGKAHAPTIMVVSGVTSMGASVVLASKKTLKIEEVLAPHVDTLEQIQRGLELETSYTEKDAKKDQGAVYGRVAVSMVKLYFVPGVLFFGGAALVFGGHRIMLKRNATLAIAFTTLKASFDKYRSRVVETFGHDADQGMLNGWVKKEVYDEKGELQMVNVRNWEESAADPYNRVFGQGETSQWTNDLGVNKLFVAGQQRMAQILLGNRGHLYLSEVYQALGFPETDISRVVGWKATRNPDGSMDIPILDFGLDKPMPDDWKYSADNAIYLDFNCMGLIIGGKVQKALEKA